MNGFKENLYWASVYNKDLTLHRVPFTKLISILELSIKFPLMQSCNRQPSTLVSWILKIHIQISFVQARTGEIHIMLENLSNNNAVTRLKTNGNWNRCYKQLSKETASKSLWVRRDKHYETPSKSKIIIHNSSVITLNINK